MTHSHAIAALLAPAERLTAGDRDALMTHVARCSDCWRALAALEVTEPADDAAMDAHFGCDAVRDAMFALVDLEPAAIAREHTSAARHLSWCLACRSRFAEIVAVEREWQRAPRWLEVGAQVREAAGRLVVRIGRAAAGLVEIPDGFVLGPALVPIPVRGADGTVDLGRAARFTLGDTGVQAEVQVDDADGGLSLRVVSGEAAPLSVRIREARPDGERLVARYSLRGTEPVLVRGLWEGSFVVELHDARDAAVHRVRLDLQS